MGIQKNIFCFGECCLKKNQNAPRPSNDISADVYHIKIVSRSSGLQYSSESYGGKQKHVENNGHSNKHFCFFGECCLKKNQDALRPCNDIGTDVQYV